MMVLSRTLSTWFIRTGTISRDRLADQNAARERLDLGEELPDGRAIPDEAARPGNPVGRLLDDDDAVSDDGEPPASTPLSDGSSSTYSELDLEMLTNAASAARSARHGHPQQIDTGSDATLVGSGPGEGPVDPALPDHGLPSYDEAAPAPAYSDVDAFSGSPQAFAAVQPDTASAKELAARWSAAKSKIAGQVDSLHLSKAVRREAKDKVKKLKKKFDKNLSGILRSSTEGWANEYLDAYEVAREYLEATLASFGEADPGGDLVRHELGGVLLAIQRHCLAKADPDPFVAQPTMSVGPRKGRR
jgi:hypothetical protein